MKGMPFILGPVHAASRHSTSHPTSPYPSGWYGSDTSDERREGTSGETDHTREVERGNVETINKTECQEIPTLYLQRKDIIL